MLRAFILCNIGLIPVPDLKLRCCEPYYPSLHHKYTLVKQLINNTDCIKCSCIAILESNVGIPIEIIRLMFFMNNKELYS